MRYLSLLAFVLIIYIVMMFTNLNHDPVLLKLRVHGLPFTFSAQLPLFLPILLAFLSGVVLTTIYFFAHHTQLRLKSHLKENELRKLKKALRAERHRVEPSTPSSSEPAISPEEEPAPDPH